MDNLLYIIVGISIPVALLLCGILGWEVRRSFAVANLYRSPVRDLRFVCALLRYYLPGGKWRILRNPCLLTDDRNAPARADLLVIGGGGVLILTVDDRKGHFSTPPSGDWTIWQDGKNSRVENKFAAGRQYTSVINGILVRHGLSCSVLNLVVLSDDFAAADDLYAEHVMTCNQLVPYVKRFCKGKLLPRREQKQIREAIASHHTHCREVIAQAEAEAAARASAPMDLENLFDNLVKPAEGEDGSPAEQGRPESEQE